MSAAENTDGLTLDIYIRGLGNQEIKGILLKLKNELRKEDCDWEDIKTLLGSIKRKSPETLKDIVLLIVD